MSSNASRVASPARPGSSSGLAQAAAGLALASRNEGLASSKPEMGNTRMELPPDAYVTSLKKSMFPRRENKFNSEGKIETIEVNQYRMTNFDFKKKIYQYDVRVFIDYLRLLFC